MMLFCPFHRYIHYAANYDQRFSLNLYMKITCALKLQLNFFGFNTPNLNFLMCNILSLTRPIKASITTALNCVGLVLGGSLALKPLTFPDTFSTIGFS